MYSTPISHTDLNDFISNFDAIILDHCIDVIILDHCIDIITLDRWIDEHEHLTHIIRLDIHTTSINTTIKLILTTYTQWQLALDVHLTR